MRRARIRKEKMGSVRASLAGEVRVVRALEASRHSLAWPLLAVGLVLGLLGAAILATELVHIQRQQAHRAELGRFLRRKGLSLRYLPKVRSSHVLDVTGTAFSAAGLVLLIAGWDRRRNARWSSRFRVGQTADCDYVVGEAEIHAGWMDLMSWKEGGWRVIQPKGANLRCFRPSGETWVVVDPEPLMKRDESGRRFFELAEDMRCELSMGLHHFVLSTEERLPIEGSAKFGRESVGFYVGSLAFHGGLLLLLMATPPEASVMNPDSLNMRGRFQTMALRDQRAKMQRVAKRREKRMPVKVAERKVRRHQRRAGPVDERIKQVSGGSGSGPAHGRGRAGRPSNAGIAGALGRMDGKILSSVFARDSALSSEAEQTLGHLVGNTSGDAFGIDALGLNGGRGGGPSGAGAIGLGTWGSPFGPGGGGGVLSPGNRGGGYDLPTRHQHHKIVSLSTSVDVTEGVSPAIIRRVIRRHLSEIRYCYVQFGLVVSAKASGRVKVRFSIDRNGRVVSAGVVSSSMHLPAMERCIARAVRRWRFPRLGRDTGLVLVGYPFIFHSPNR